MNEMQYLDYQRGLRRDRGQTDTAVKQKGKLDVAVEAVIGMQNRVGQVVLLPDFYFCLLFPWFHFTEDSMQGLIMALTDSNLVFMLFKCNIFLKEAALYLYLSS